MYYSSHFFKDWEIFHSYSGFVSVAMICVINTLSIKMEKWAQKIKSTFVFTMQSSNYASTLLVGLLPFFALFLYLMGVVCVQRFLSAAICFWGYPTSVAAVQPAT